MVGRKQNMAPMWKKLMKLVDLDNQHFLSTMCMPCQCLGTLGPYLYPMRQLSRKNPTRYNVPLLAGPYNAVPTDLLKAGSVCGIGSDLRWIHIMSLAARFRTAGSSGSLVNGLAKIREGREYDGGSIFCSQSRMAGKVPENVHCI